MTMELKKQEHNKGLTLSKDIDIIVDRKYSRGSHLISLVVKTRCTRWVKIGVG